MNLIRDEQLEKLLLKIQEEISQLRCVLTNIEDRHLDLMIQR